MVDEVKFIENENAWLLTLPEVRLNGIFLPSCTIVAIRTLKDTYAPAAVAPGEKQILAGRTCTLALYLNGGGWDQEPKYIAEFTQNIWDGSTMVDLTNHDFLVPYKLRGRGLGTWVMQQLICWARTLPADTPVAPIRTSPVDEKDKENMCRRDHFWHGIGFRFRANSRQSQPLCVADLQLPQGKQSTLRAVPLHTAVGELIRTCEEQHQKIENLEEARQALLEDNRRLQGRQWDILLVNGVMAILMVPFQITFWIWKRLIALKGKPDDR